MLNIVCHLSKWQSHTRHKSCWKRGKHFLFEQIFSIETQIAKWVIGETKPFAWNKAFSLFLFCFLSSPPPPLYLYLSMAYSHFHSFLLYFLPPHFCQSLPFPLPILVPSWWLSVIFGICGVVDTVFRDKEYIGPWFTEESQLGRKTDFSPVFLITLSSEKNKRRGNTIGLIFTNINQEKYFILKAM